MKQQHLACPVGLERCLVAYDEISVCPALSDDFLDPLFVLLLYRVKTNKAEKAWVYAFLKIIAVLIHARFCSYMIEISAFLKLRVVWWSVIFGDIAGITQDSCDSNMICHANISLSAY